MVGISVGALRLPTLRHNAMDLMSMVGALRLPTLRHNVKGLM